MKRILKITLVLSTLLGLFSCAKYGSTYDIPKGNPCVSFPSEELIVKLNEAAVIKTVNIDGKDMKVFTAELWRGNTEGSATINVDIDMDDEAAGIFMVGKNCFEFANGENKACIEFIYDPDEIEKGKDYVTLVTCTPFGVNSHRLLVRGERAEVPEITAISAENEQPMDSPSTWTQHYLKGLGIGAALLAVCLGAYFIYRRKKCEK